MVLTTGTARRRGLGGWTVSVQAISAILMGAIASVQLWMALPAAAAACVAGSVIGGERALARRWGSASSWVVIIGAVVLAAAEAGVLLWFAAVIARELWWVDHGEAGLELLGFVLPVFMIVAVVLAWAPLLALREAILAMATERQAAGEAHRA